MSFNAPEAKGDSKFLTFSISRGPGEGGEKKRTIWHPRQDVEVIYMADGPRVRVNLH